MYTTHSMNQYKTFIFDSYAFDKAKRTISLVYKLDDAVTFTETITLPADLHIQDHPDLDSALFALHLMGGISYYKTCLPKAIDIRSGSLSEKQTSFWNDVYENGLGEFFYRNDIDFSGLIHFPSTGNKPTINKSESKKDGNKRVLIPIGGGKDSLVTTELLKKGGSDCTLLRIGQHQLIDTMANEAQLPLLNVKRALAPELFTLNADGALNGHVPITGYIHFLSVIIGLLGGYGYVAFSNEESAEEGNVEFHGKQINHQWSKSLAFEQMFQAYVADCVTKDVTCFSMLRTLSELKIAELFCEHRQYLPLATSCNRNWQILSKDPNRPRWCGDCPKCAFAFALFAAFLPKNDLEGVFNGNLFEDESLLPLYRELLGVTGHKPFECVGTPEETAAAFVMAHNRGELEDTAAMKMFLDDVMPEIIEPDEIIGEAMLQRPKHAIPDQFLPLLKNL